MNIRIRICKIKNAFWPRPFGFFHDKSFEEKNGDPLKTVKKTCTPFFCATPRCLTVIMYTTNRFEPEAIADCEKSTCLQFLSSSSWWFQPIWKICSSNWDHLPQGIGVKIPKISELPPPSPVWYGCFFLSKIPLHALVLHLFFEHPHL